MDLKQKYTEEEFEIDEFFVKQMKKFKNGTSVKIASMIDNIYGSEETNGFIKNRTGHVNDNEGVPIFFSIDYFRDKDGPIVLIDAHEISLDSYLDSINDNLHIK